MASAVLLFVSALLTSILLSTQAVPPSPSLSCTDELVSFSPCLPYVSSPPNEQSELPSPSCCSVFNSSSGVCLCYLLREPRILGFLVNVSRLLSLPSVCPSILSNGSSYVGSLKSLCSGSSALPPLRSPSTTLGIRGTDSDVNDAVSPNTPPRASESAPAPEASADKNFDPPELHRGPLQYLSGAEWNHDKKSLLLAGMATFLVHGIAYFL